MLVFLIHGVATQNAGYGDKFKRKVKELLLKASTNREAAAENDIKMPVFYSSFWGHTFKSQTDQIFNWVRSDIKEITNRHPDLKDKGNDTVFLLITGYNSNPFHRCMDNSPIPQNL